MSLNIIQTALSEISADHQHTDHLLQALSDPAQIPPFHPTVSQPNTIVSFRCMLQDTTSQPEVFLPFSESDSLEDQLEGEIDYSKLRERTVVWAVGVPGESPWVQQILSPSSPTNSTRSAQPIDIHPSIAHKFPCAQSGEGSEAEKTGAFVKFYDESAHSPLTVHTIIGLLTFAPAEEPTVFPSSSSPSSSSSLPLFPTIHVLTSTSHSDPLVPLDRLPTVQPGVEWDTLRAELIDLICQVGLGGEDTWVGEWVLGLICQKNQPPLIPLTASLLLPVPSSLPLRHLLRHLLPTVHPLSLSIPTLNKTQFEPCSTKNEDLQAGALQVPKGGLLWIDESGLGEGGVLDEKGLGNLEAIKGVLADQIVHFRFPFSSFAFPMDLNVLVIGDSKGGTLLPVDVKIPLRSLSKAYSTKEEVDSALPSSDKMARFRSLIGRAREGSLVVPASVSEAIQTHFVSHRKTHGPSSISADDLGTRMRFARALALSMGRKEMDVEVWEKAWGLDEVRLGKDDRFGSEGVGRGAGVVGMEHGLVGR